MALKPTYKELHQRILELEKAEDELDQIFIMSLDMICVADLHTATFLKVNPAFVSTLGFSEDELLSRPFLEFMHPEDIEPTRRVIENKLLGGYKVINFENRYRCKDGIYKWLSWVSHPCPEKGITYAVARDITEKKRMDSALVNSEKKWKNILVNTPQIGVSMDSRARITFANAYLLTLTGWQEHEILGKDWFSLFIPENQRENLREVFNHIMGNPETPRYSTYENEIITKSGDLRNVAWSNVLTYDPTGNIMDVTCLGIDLTERIRSERALRESEDKYRHLFELESDAIFLIEKDTGSILEVNASASDMYGYSRQELLAMKNTDLSAEPEKTTQATHKKLHEIPIRYHKKKDGRVFPVEITASHLAWDGIEAHIAAIRDISFRIKADEERAKLEKELSQAQKMESISTLAGGIAHDFNNMLGVLTGNLSYALSILSRDDDLFEPLSDALQGARDAQSLTRQLLTFAKGGEPIKKTSHITTLIEKTAQFVTRGSSSKCRFNFTDDLWPVDIDEGQINQAITNMIINASQAMPDGGVISIKALNHNLLEPNALSLPPGRYVQICFKDQGIGISDKLLTKIFDPFFTTKQKGSGLGLATTYSIIKRHKGHITVESILGQGSTFRILLPASENRVEVEDTQSFIQHHGQGRILVMDDQEGILKMLERIMAKMGYEMVSAYDGGQAIDLFRDAFSKGNPFDLVILDLTVPGGMGGAKTIPELLKIDPKVKAVVSSGYSNDPIMANYQDYGFIGVIPKPYTKTEIADIFNKFL